MTLCFGMLPWCLVSSATGGAYWPIAIRRPSLGTFPSIGRGVQPHTTLCPSSSSLPNHSLSTSLSFPLVRCANGAPGLSLFHFFVSSPHRGGQMPSPLAGCVQAVIPDGQWWTPPQRWLLGLATSTCRVFSPTGAHNDLPSVHHAMMPHMKRTKKETPIPAQHLMSPATHHPHAPHMGKETQYTHHGRKGGYMTRSPQGVPSAGMGDGWRGGWLRPKSGAGLVPLGVGGVRSKVVCRSVRCSRSCGLGHYPWLAPLFSVRLRRALPHRRRLLLSGGWCRVLGGGVLGCLLAHTL